MQKTILITGVNGFIGRNLAQALRTSYRIVGTGRTATTPAIALNDYKQIQLPHPSFEELLQKWHPNVLIHCAGYGSVPLSVHNPTVDFDAGPRLVLHVLDALRRTGVKAQFIFPSSAAVYGNPEKLPITETHPLRPLSPYGYHKILSEQIIHQYYELYKQEYIILRIFSCYGEGLTKQLLWDIAQQVHTGTVELFGTGHETRDFIHVEDLARAIEFLLAKEISISTLNLAGGQQTSVREIARLLLQELGADVPLRFKEEERKGDPLHWEADISRLQAHGFSPRISLQEGVRRFALWYLEHYGNPL